MTNILLVTSWNTPCGIADHSAQLKAAVEAADPEFVVQPHSLGPDDPIGNPAILHVNYHEAVTTAWTLEILTEFRRYLPLRLVVTYHNTFGEHTPAELRAVRDHRLDLLEQFCEVADAVVVHEPCRGLPHPGRVYEWRQGVRAAEKPDHYTWPDGVERPLLGTVGFPHPWKNYDRLCAITREAGWGIAIFAAGATGEDETRWHGLNPYAFIRREFYAGNRLVQYLSGCDATAFCYEGAFAGTSGAIRLGIAARKPVLAFSGQRQMRDLWLEYPDCFEWCESWEGVAWRLRHLPIARVHPPMVYVAEQDSWTWLGQRYAQLYRSLLT